MLLSQIFETKDELDSALRQLETAQQNIDNKAQQLQEATQQNKELRSENETLQLKMDELQASTPDRLPVEEAFMKENVQKMLFEYYATSNKKRGENLLNKIGEYLKSLVDGAKGEHLRSSYDRSHNGFFKRLLAQIPKLSDAEIKLVTALSLGCGSRASAMLAGLTPRAFYTYLQRLRVKVKKANAPDMDEFLAFLTPSKPVTGSINFGNEEGDENTSSTIAETNDNK